MKRVKKENGIHEKLALVVLVSGLAFSMFMLLSDNSFQKISGNSIQKTGRAARVATAAQPSQELGNPIPPPVFIEDPSRLKILVLLLKASDDTNNPPVFRDIQNNINIAITRDYIRNVWLGNTNSVKSFFQENSNGKLVLDEANVDVRDYITLPYSKADCTIFQSDTWKNAAQQELLRTSDIRINDYTFVIYVPASWSCGAAGQVTLGQSQALIFDPQLKVFVHETGHLFGLFGHASIVDCGSRRQIADISYFARSTMDRTRRCSVIDSSDRSDILNEETLGVANFIAPHRDFFGWLPSDRVRSITSTTRTIRIFYLGSAQGPQAVKIPKRNGIENMESFRRFPPRYSSIESYYYLSFRAPLGYDASLDPQFTTGGSLHLATFYRLINPTAKGYTGEVRSLLVYTNPNDAVTAFRDNTIFTDPLDGITIVQTSHDSISATFSITVTPVASRNPPYPCQTCRADIDGNGIVSRLDSNWLFACFGKRATDSADVVSTCRPADINGNGVVTILDFSCLASKFNRAVPPEDYRNEPICAL